MKKIMMALVASTMLVSFSAPTFAAFNPTNIYESSHTVNILNAIDEKIADGETAGIFSNFAWAYVNGKVYSLSLNELRKHGSNAGKFFSEHVGAEVRLDIAEKQEAVSTIVELAQAGVSAERIVTITEIERVFVDRIVGDVDAYDRGFEAGAASITPDPMDGSFADGAASVTPEDGITQADVDAANMAEGPGSAYARGFAAGAMQEGGELGLSTDQIIDRINATSEAMIVTITGTPASSDYAPATFRGIRDGDYFVNAPVGHFSGSAGTTTYVVRGTGPAGSEQLGDWYTTTVEPMDGHNFGNVGTGNVARNAEIGRLNNLGDDAILVTGQVGEAASSDYTRVVNTEITADYLVSAVGNGVPARVATSADVVADSYINVPEANENVAYSYTAGSGSTRYVTYEEDIGWLAGSSSTSATTVINLNAMHTSPTAEAAAAAAWAAANGEFVAGNGVVPGVTMIDAVASTEYTLSFTGGDLNANELATYAIENGVVASESAYSPYTGKDDAAEALGFRYGRADNYGAGRAAYSGAPEIQVFTYNAAVQAAPARPAEVGDFYETDRSGRYIYSTTNDGGAEWRYESNTGTSRWATTDGRDSLGTISGTLPSADMSDSFVTTRYNQDFTATEAREHNRRLGTDTSANFLFGEVIDANHLREIQQAVNAAYDQGYEDGYKDGFADGYTVGFSDGVDSVTR